MLILSTATLLGNEFSVGVFIHPALSRADHERFLPAIQVLAALFGKIMPFWMAATVLLHLILLGLSWDWPAAHTVLLLAATLLWLAIIVFSLIGPVPINDQVTMGLSSDSGFRFFAFHGYGPLNVYARAPLKVGCRAQDPNKDEGQVAWCAVYPFYAKYY